MSEIFISYAGADRKKYQETMDAFVFELAEAVSYDAALARNGLEFYAPRSLDVGVDWNDKLVQELNKCQVFVAFYSHWYFKSPHCGKEFWYFSERGDSSRIIPVFASPPAKFEKTIPEVLTDLQDIRKRPEWPEAYRLGGLPFLTVGSPEFAQTIQAYSNLITKILEQPALFPEKQGPAPTYEQAQDFFLINRPMPSVKRDPLDPRAKFYVAAADLKWKPCCPPEDATLPEIVETAVRGFEFQYEIDIADSGLLPKLEHDVKSKRVVTVVIDAASMPSALVPQAEEIDKMNHVNLLVLPTCNPRDPDLPKNRPSIEKRLEEAFPRRCGTLGSSKFLFTPQTGRELADKVIREVRAAHGRLLFAGDPNPLLEKDRPPTSLDSDI